MNHFRDQLSTVRKNYVWWLRSLQSWAVWSATTTTFPGDATMRFGTKLSSSNLAFEMELSEYGASLEFDSTKMKGSRNQIESSHPKNFRNVWSQMFSLVTGKHSPGPVFVRDLFFGKISWTETRNTIPEKNLHTASHRLTCARCIKMHDIP